MANTGSLPLSGYALSNVYLTTAELKPKTPPGTSEPESVVNLGWDWRYLQSDSVFEVRLTLALEPEKERPYYASVDAVGRFRRIGETPASVAIEDFAALQAVAILMPYARQHLTNLTVNTLSGPYFLPSINVTDMMQSFDRSKTTAAREGAPVASPQQKRSKAGKGKKTPRSN